jgi:mono/diheme cytochrome c family protein
MKSLPVLLLLSGLAGFVVYQGGESPIYASSSGIAAQAAETSSDKSNAAGAAAYAENCAICHGDNREGNLPAFPPLLGISRQMTEPQIVAVIHDGKGRMPGFPDISKDQVAAIVRFLSASTPPAPAASATSEPKSGNADVAAGKTIFQQNCAFCHGRDTMGGETGPDLTRSKLVLADVNGDKISEVVHNGRPEKKMPGFDIQGSEMTNLVAFIHAQAAAAASKKGARKGVDVADLQTGNLEAGKKYFDAKCVACHSATGDLKGIASRFEGLQLEEQMLYPREAKDKVTITLPSGETVKGTVAYHDEWTIGIRDQNNAYRSWKVNKVRIAIDPGLDGHVALFPQYSDADIHNLMAYLQTLR